MISLENSNFGLNCFTKLKKTVENFLNVMDFSKCFFTFFATKKSLWLPSSSADILVNNHDPTGLRALLNQEISQQLSLSVASYFLLLLFEWMTAIALISHFVDVQSFQTSIKQKVLLKLLSILDSMHIRCYCIWEMEYVSNENSLCVNVIWALKLRIQCNEFYRCLYAVVIVLVVVVVVILLQIVSGWKSEWQ